MNNIVTVIQYVYRLLNDTYLSFYPFRFSLWEFFSFMFIASLVALFINKVFLD